MNQCCPKLKLSKEELDSPLLAGGLSPMCDELKGAQGWTVSSDDDSDCEESGEEATSERLKCNFLSIISH